MNTPWVIWLFLFAGSFAVLERYAFNHPARENTLSRFIWSLGQKWPLTLVLWGMLIGGLSVHFFWNWCPLLMLPGQGG